MNKESWRKLIIQEMELHDDIDSHIFMLGDRVGTNGNDCRSGFWTLNKNDLDVEFDSNYGNKEGPGFRVWTPNRVYFPVLFDGAECVGSVTRDPSEEKPAHFGDGEPHP